MQIPTFLKYFISILLNFKYIQSITTCQAKIPILSPCYMPPSTSVQTCKPFIISAFYFFRVNTIISKQLYNGDVFKLLYYFQLTKLKEVR